jgi:trk system potassium uptake protein TrkA
MSINRSYAIFGLGRYGLSVARELVNNGADVLAVDQNQSIVNAAISDIPLCKCADITDPDVIRNLGLSNIDVVVIAMASNLEAAVMATMLCKEAGVKTVIVKCANEVHGKILSRVGADKVVIPEKESGTRLAKNLLSAGFVDVIELSEDVSLIELDVKTDWVGKTLIELNLRKKYGINVVAIRCGSDLQINVDPTMQLDKTMQLVVITNKEKINKLKD